MGRTLTGDNRAGTADVAPEDFPAGATASGQRHANRARGRATAAPRPPRAIGAGRGGARSGDAGSLVGRPLAGLDQVDPATWDRLVPPGNAALRHHYLRAWEHAELAGLRSSPLVACEPGSGLPVAACPGYWYDLDLPGTRVPRAAPFLRAVRGAWPRFLMARTYELGSPTPLTNPFMVLDRTRRESAVRTLGETALAAAEDHRAQFVLVQNLPSLDVPAAQALLPLGFLGVPILPTVVVDLPYASFDEYLGAMRSQYRRRAHQTLRRSEGLRVEHRRHFADLSGELAHLWRLIYDRATELRREVLTPAYFRAMSDVEESSVLLLRRSDGSVASFGLLLADPPWLSFLYCGFDAAAGREEGAYFRLLYEIIRTAIDGGFRHAELGVTTVGPKLDVGGVPVPLFALLKHRSTLLHRAIGAFATGPVSPDDVRPRRVFKEAPPTAAELVAMRDAGR